MEKRELLCLVGGNATGAVPVENSVEIPQKIKNRAIIWSSGSTSGYLSEENNNANLKKYLEPYVHGSIIYISQGMEATEDPSIDGLIMKMWYICIHTMEYYLAIKGMKSCHLQQYG